MHNLFYILQPLSEFAENTTRNGILTFILGTLFILTIYHFFIFLQNKDRTYLYYSVYTGLIFLAFVRSVETGFLKNLVDMFNFPPSGYKNLCIWIYNCFYFFFAAKFLNLKSINPKWNDYMIKPIAVILSLAFIVQILKTFFGLNTIYTTFDKLYLPIVTIQTILSYYFIFKLQGPLKHYIIAGGIILFVTSVVGEDSIYPYLNLSKSQGEFVFFMGVLLENICFSLGLGYKQKNAIKERRENNQALIEKLQENEALKEEINQQLQEKINVLNNQIALKGELEDLKLSALRSQMNPHFVFNALNSIKHYIINNEQKNAVHYLNKFSKLIRKILDASTVREVSLTEELETMQLYMSIENIRFNNTIDYEVFLDKTLNLSTIKVPPLILQPFLENAIWHGLSSKSDKKQLSVSIKQSNAHYITIEIEDNGIGRKASETIKESKSIKRKSLGISLTKDRLTHFLKDLSDDFKITYQDLADANNNACGTKVILKIPTK